MELIHKILTDKYTWEEIIHHYTEEDSSDEELYKTPLYCTGDGCENLDVNNNELMMHGYGVMTTQPINMTSGKWRLDAPNYETRNYSLYLIPSGIYRDQQPVTKIADLKHNDTVEITDGVYILVGDEDWDDGIVDWGVVIIPRVITDNPEVIVHESYTETVVDEPIGFDKLQVEMKRHDYHGIGAEVSAGTLEFYGKAFDVIKSKYDADIDEEILYQVTGNGVQIYRGQIDLSTLSIKEGNYQSLSVKVGEIGVKTTFNNRVDTPVDLASPKTIDGADVEKPTWQNLLLPYKHLKYANVSTQNATVLYTGGGGTSDPTGGIHFTDADDEGVFLPIGDNETNEFGSFNQQTPPYTTDDASVVDPQYYPNEDHVQMFGRNTTTTLDIMLKIRVIPLVSPTFEPVYAEKFANDVRVVLVALFYRGDTLTTAYSDITRSTNIYNFDLKLNLTGANAFKPIRYFIKCTNGKLSADLKCNISVLKGSYVKMEMQDNLPRTTNNVRTDLILMHDALNVVVHAISENELGVVSEWYRTPESKWYPGSVGGGACKALTDGYHIRGIYRQGENERNMPMSFKELIDSLSALDCIGWGFSTIDDKPCIRVERWDWFYRNTVVLNLSNVAEVTTDAEPDSIPTEFIIGYKKYATTDQFNSINSPHGKRTFASGIKAVSKTVNKLCDFIADNYAIEETRRARFLKNETDETSYDENIFVIELARHKPSGNAYYAIHGTAYNAVGVGDASEFFNAKITPRHMAARWRDYLFPANSDLQFRFMAGEINYKASFNCVATVYVGANNETINTLRSMATSSPQAENEDITHTASVIKAEKITFSYPITLAQYNAVKANPYGMIGVNGRYGWIKDFKYTFATGMASFTLISKR